MILPSSITLTYNTNSKTHVVVVTNKLDAGCLSKIIVKFNLCNNINSIYHFNATLIL